MRAGESSWMMRKSPLSEDEAFPKAAVAEAVLPLSD